MAKKEQFKTMEDAKNGVPEEVRTKLGKLWEMAKTKGYMSEGKEYIRIGRVSDELNKAISTVLEKEVKAEMQYIRLKDVKHIDDEHGVGKEKKPDQIPITKDIFTLTKDVLKNFDGVKKGSKTAGRDSVTIMKNYSDGRIVIANAILLNGNLAITSMFVKKPTTISA